MKVCRSCYGTKKYYIIMPDRCMPIECPNCTSWNCKETIDIDFSWKPIEGKPTKRTILKSVK